MPKLLRTTAEISLSGSEATGVVSGYGSEGLPSKRELLLSSGLAFFSATKLGQYTVDL